MKLYKLLEIQTEAVRFNKKLNDAIVKATSNEKDFDGKTIPLEDRDCTGSRESAAVKRAAMDLKKELSNLHLNQ